MGMVVAGRVDWSNCWGKPAWIHLLGGVSAGIHLLGRNGDGVFVGLLVGHRSCTLCAGGLAIACVRGGSSLSDERTERGTAALVAGLDRYVVGNILVFIVRSVVFQDSKRVVILRVLLMNWLHLPYIGRCCGIM